LVHYFFSEFEKKFVLRMTTGVAHADDFVVVLIGILRFLMLGGLAFCQLSFK
jgi:hypothetical protein